MTQLDTEAMTKRRSRRSTPTLVPKRPGALSAGCGRTSASERSFSVELYARTVHRWILWMGVIRKLGCVISKPRLTCPSTPLGNLPAAGRCPDEITMSYPSMPRANLHTPPWPGCIGNVVREVQSRNYTRQRVLSGQSMICPCPSTKWTRK